MYFIGEVWIVDKYCTLINDWNVNVSPSKYIILNADVVVVNAKGRDFKCYCYLGNYLGIDILYTLFIYLFLA